MDTIDELGRRAGRTALAEAEAYTDVEAGLARILADEEDVDWNVDGGSRRGWVVVLAAAAAVVAAVTAGVVWSQEDPSPRLVPGTPPEPTPAPTTPATPEPTAPATPQPTTPATPEPQPAEPSGLAVSYLDPPPSLQPEVFATVDAPSEFFLNAVVTENGGVVVLDRATESALVVDPDGTSRPVPLDVMPSSLVAAGPGDVVYALGQSEQQTETRVLAIALSGERAGQVVASTPPFDISPYLELPVGAIGHGPEGIIDRARRVGEQLMGYVDRAGRPVDVDWQEPRLLTIDEDGTVRSDDEGTEWALDIEHHPQAPTPLEGPSPPVPDAIGGATYWTGIGPPDDPGAEFPNSTINVVALLYRDGSGEWHRLPDGWEVVASDTRGTIIGRRVGEQMEVAHVIRHSEPLPPPPPSTAEPEPSPLATLAEAIGASTAIAREPRKVTVFADGTTTEVATPPDVYVQTDGTLLWWDIGTGETTSRSAAATLDGTIVCEVEGTIHRVRQEADGGYVASVERRDEIAGIAEEIAVPNYAVDCDTGSIEPIEPVSWRWEVGTRRIERIGDSTFTSTYDAEGNGDVTNEAGISINGDDYAGYHTFNADGSRVVYGDMTAQPGPHVTNVLRSRDTTTGELLWSAELDRPVGLTYWYGDRIIALAPADGVPGATVESVIVLDAVTGEVIETVSTTLDLAFVE
jgi:hypothetical protein